MPHTVTARVRTGTARDGSATYAADASVRCRAVEKREEATDQRTSGGTFGQTVLTSLTLWCDPSATISPESRVVYRGRESEVVSTTEGVGGNGQRVYLKVQCV